MAIKINRTRITAAVKPKIVRPKRVGKNTSVLDAVEYTGNAETDSLAEMDAVKQGFRDRKLGEQARFKDATDSEYWVAVCFQNREQKEEFLRKAGIIDLGDKYLDGMKVADRLGVELTAEVGAMPKLKNHKGQFKNLIREVE